MASQAKTGQKLLLDRDISKNLFFVILPYLKCFEITRLRLSSRKINLKLTSDSFYNLIMLESLQKFMLQ